MQSEKNARASLKAAVERELSKESVLIADDLNYIKGYRYELFCIARALGECSAQSLSETKCLMHSSKGSICRYHVLHCAPRRDARSDSDVSLRRGDGRRWAQPV